MTFASLTPQWISALVSVGWLTLALLAFISALPIILRLTKEKSFTVSIAGFQVSVQNATEQIGNQLRDLQDRVRSLEDGPSPTATPVDALQNSPTSAPHNASVPTPAAHRARRILWVDDFPSNNAFAVEKLRNDGFEVVLCESTSSGFRRFRDQEFGLVISDMGRKEREGNNPTAGLDLLRLIKGSDPGVPVVFFASRRAVSQHREEAIALGALDVTASAVTLFDYVASAFDAPVQR